MMIYIIDISLAKPTNIRRLRSHTCVGNPRAVVCIFLLELILN